MILRNNIKRHILSAALPALLLLIGAATPAARAADVTWNYVGNPFDTAVGLTDPLLGDSIIASFTFNGPLAPNLTDADLSADIVSWTMGDSYGIFSYTSGEADVTLLGAYFSTDAQGNISANFFQAPEAIEVDAKVALDCDPAAVSCGNSIVCADSKCMSINDWLPNFVNPPAGPDFFRLEITSNISGFEGISGSDGADVLSNGGDAVYLTSPNPGVWTESPEPGTVLMLGTGLLGLAAAGKRRLFR
jgi:hypothetical protein